MAYLEELLPEFRKGAKIRRKHWASNAFIQNIDDDDIDIKDLYRDDWELYQEPIDWDYIIKNKCLCWLWDDNYNWAICGTLGKIEKGDEYKFVMFDDEGNRSPYKNCRPVSRDEVTFYEDKKDEQD